MNLSNRHKVQSSREILAQIELALKEIPVPNPLRRNFDYGLDYLEKVKRRLKEKKASIPEHPNKVIVSSKFGELTDMRITALATQASSSCEASFRYILVPNSVFTELGITP